MTGATRMVDMVLDAGVNMIDTADVYSDGVSEEIVGEVLAGRRKDVLLATKARFPMGPGPNDQGLSRHHIVEACEASLRRMKTDYIDLYWCHEWDGLTPVEETLRALDELTRAGKIRYFGVSNFSGWHVMKFLGAADLNGLSRPIAQQIHYTLQARDAERELLPIAIDQDVAAVVWSPLAGGLLTGKYRRNQPEPDGTRRAEEWDEPPVYDADALYDMVETLIEVSEEYGDATPAQVALAWLLGRRGVASLVVGARTEAQLQANLKAVDVTLSPEASARLERVSRRPLSYPYWHQANTAAERLSPADLSLIAPYLSS